jgi:hypothetical protein
MQEWLAEHMLVSYLLIVGFTIYIFNSVFRPVRKLPVLKEIAVYVCILLGSLVLLILQVDKLPIIQCMAVAVALMLVLRLRQLYDRWRKGRGSDGAGSEQPGGKGRDAADEVR